MKVAKHISRYALFVIIFLIVARGWPGFAAAISQESPPTDRARSEDHITSSGLLYGVNASGELLSIIPNRFTEEVVGPIGVAAVRALAYDHRSDTLWGLSRDGKLLIIDRLTGAGKPIQTLAVPGTPFFSSLAFVSNNEGAGYLYAANAAGNRELLRIDLGAAPYSVTILGSTGDQVTGLAFDPKMGGFYAVNRNRNALGVLNSSSALFETVFPNCGISNPEGLAFDLETRTLYGVFFPNTLGTYNLANGQATAVAATQSDGALTFARHPPSAGSSRPIQVGEEIVQTYETIHPYGSGTVPQREIVTSITIRHPGATYIAPHFARFGLKPEDFVIVRSPDSTRSWRYERFGKGDLGIRPGGFWGVHIPGDTAIIELHVRSAGIAYGYKIDKYARGFTDAEIDGLSGIESLCGVDDSKNAKCYASSEANVYNRSKPVARLLIQGINACTGWLFGSEGHILTNHHCINSAAAAQDIDIEFGAEGGTCDTPCSSPLACAGTVVANSSTLVRSDMTRDYALIKPNTTFNLPTTYGYLQARTTGAVLGERIYIPQHPKAWGKRLAVASSHPGDLSSFVQISDLAHASCYGGPQPLDIGYFGDTQGGSSGSPVLAHDDHLVVGLHHCGGCPNGAVPIEEVMTHLGPDLPECARGTDLGCPNSGLPLTGLPECAACVSDLQCTFPATCRNGKCATARIKDVGASCCEATQCKSGRCGSSGLCECSSNIDCPVGRVCRRGNCLEAQKEECEGCLFDFQCRPLDCRFGFCIQENSKGLNQKCCRDIQCISGSCAADKTCQCRLSSDCPTGFYCDIGALSVIRNECMPYKEICDFCTADKQCGPGRRCDGKPAGRCITGSENLPLGAQCCRADQCRSGSCTLDNGICQCDGNGDCPAGSYCALGFLGVGRNSCRPFIGECEPCITSAQCGPGALCRATISGLRCATGNSRGKGESCCSDHQCRSGRCKLNRTCK